MEMEIAAKRGMNKFHRFLARKSLRDLHEVLADGEYPTYIALTQTFNKYYLFIITNKRIIHYRKSSRENDEIFSVEYLNIKSFEVHGKFIKGKIKVITENEEKIINFTNPSCVSEVLNLTNEMIYEKNKVRSYNARKKSKFSNQYIKARKLDEDYVVIDFETTGLSANKEEIIQIGAVKYRNHKEVDRFHTYIKPSKKVSKRITDITGITNEMLEEAPSMNEQIDNLIKFIDDMTLVAHNAYFDMAFLYTLTDKGYKIPKYRVVDTLALARKNIIDVDNHKLVTLSKYLNIDHNAHDALGDCLATAEVYKHCYIKQSELK